MRVLTGKVLVAVRSMSSDSLVGDITSRRGIVDVSGSMQVELGASVLFGEGYEEIKLERDSTKRYYLMSEENIKIIYDDIDPPAQSNVLSFFKETVNG